MGPMGLFRDSETSNINMQNKFKNGEYILSGQPRGPNAVIEIVTALAGLLPLNFVLPRDHMTLPWGAQHMLPNWLWSNARVRILDPQFFLECP